MDEILDIVDESGRPTGKTVGRKEAHATGARHRTAHIWVARQKPGGYDVLLQKRSMQKDSFPGCYDTSSAGHIQAGDEPLPSALRELQEELGITAKAEDLAFAGTFRIQYQTEFYGKPFQDDEVAFVYVYRKPVRAEELTLQKEELDAAEWFDLQQTLKSCEAHDPKFCVPVGGLKTLIAYLCAQG